MDADEIHFKMSKKVAQLTKVIYHLNTRNDDADLHVQVNFVPAGSRVVLKPSMVMLIKRDTVLMQTVLGNHEQEVQHVSSQATQKLRSVCQRISEGVRMELQTAIDRNKEHCTAQILAATQDVENERMSLVLRERKLCDGWELRLKQCEQQV